jgi:hypothetical protein
VTRPSVTLPPVLAEHAPAARRLARDVKRGHALPPIVASAADLSGVSVTIIGAFTLGVVVGVAVLIVLLVIAAWFYLL